MTPIIILFSCGIILSGLRFNFCQIVTATGGIQAVAAKAHIGAFNWNQSAHQGGKKHKKGGKKGLKRGDRGGGGSVICQGVRKVKQALLMRP